MGFCPQSQYCSLTPTWPHLQEIIKYSILMWADKWRQPFFGSIHWKDVALFRHTYSPERNGGTCDFLLIKPCDYALLSPVTPTSQTPGFSSNKGTYTSEFGANVFTCSSFVTEAVQKAAVCTFPDIFRASTQGLLIHSQEPKISQSCYCRMQPGHIKGKDQLQSRGLSAHILTRRTLSSAPNSNISTAPKSSGRWKFWVKLHHGQWGPTALNKKACSALCLQGRDNIS